MEAAKSPSLHFVCSVCQTALDSSALQRSHVKSDWHVYNLKRRIASLPPLSAQVFEQQVAGRTGAATVEANPDTYGSANSNNFLESGTLEFNESDESSDNNIASNIASDESAPLEPFVSSRCLFCRLDAPNFSLNLQHMQKDHGLFLPNPEYLVDLETFVGYLYTVIDQFHECLYCGACKVTGEAVRQHMLDKGHCKINTDDGSDYEDFYDFSNGEIADPNDRTVIRVQDTSGVVIPQDNRLHLPSRRTVGHRSQAHHRQLLPSPASGAGRAERSAVAKHQIGLGLRTALHDHGNQLATRGYNSMGMIDVSELQKRTLRAVEKKNLKMEARARNEYQAAVDKAQNRQKHFRPDVPGPTNG